MKKRTFLYYRFIPLLSILFLLSGCQSKEPTTPITPQPEQENPSSSQTDELPVLTTPISETTILLNTAVTVTLYDRGSKELIEECFAVCRDLENLLSRTIESSEIGKINQATTFPVEVSNLTATILERALYYSELSDGAFDLTIAPLTSIWDFTSNEPVKPSDEVIASAISHINYKNVLIDGNQVTLTDSDTSIDLGAIAKGYIADLMKSFLLEKGVKSAIINLGGNVLCVGSKPDGSAFKIGIQKPFENRNETIAIVAVKDQSVVSSGIYERYFKEDGVLYHHILNPKTGYPYDTDLISVSIICNSSTDGDGLSTTCFALGLEKGMELIDSLPDVHAVFITDNYELHYSKDFFEQVEVLESE